jgi:F-box/leucine-rich repeat protein 10/11
MQTDAELLLNFARPNNTFSSLTQANEHHNVQNAESKRGTNLALLQNGNWTTAEPNKVPSVSFSGAAGASSARMRSRSDGSAMVTRPVINGFVATDSRDQGTRVGGDVLEDGPNMVDQRLLPLVSEAAPGKPVSSLPEPKLLPPITKPLRAVVSAAEDEMDVDQSGQAQCASCNRSRVPLDGSDDAEVTWVNCDGCNRWFHILCAGFKNDREVRTVDRFICHDCRPIHGPTTFLRKSSRPRNAIDYAGLNQGFIKPSVEVPEHHYVRAIKEGSMSFLPDNFARLPPEIVTAQYFQHGIGMPEPIVVPAHLNSRTPVASLGLEDLSVLLETPVGQEEFDDLIDRLTAADDNSEDRIDCGQDLLDMVIPDGLTVRNVAELYGPDQPVEVIDVKSQQGEDKKWSMQRWADYYYESNSVKPVRNVISLEVSQSPLGRLIRRPKIVRDLDLQDSVWPLELQASGDYPKVQFYCLMSVADCYTDFHIDFGGSSVFYHILKGKKTFLFIPPKDKYLKKYEEWCNSSKQDTTFLGDQTKECYRVDLSEGDTMLIPSGWIHAVWTPEDSLVIGGNFLTRMNYDMQLKVAKIEKDTKVPMKFRYPYFQKILWYTVLKYLADDPIPSSVLDSFAGDENYRFRRQYPIYYEFGERSNDSPPGSDYYNARFYSQAELDGLPELSRYILRTALIAGGYPVDGVAKEARNAVNRSIPKGQGDPIDTARKFGIWVAWKRGNEPAPAWTRPGAITPDTKLDISGKPGGRPYRRSERNAKPSKLDQSRHSEHRTASVSMASDGRESPSINTTPPQAQPEVPSDIKIPSEDAQLLRSRNSGLGPKRVACDVCRKRRIRCRHRLDQNPENQATTVMEQNMPATAAASDKGLDAGTILPTPLGNQLGSSFVDQSVSSHTPLNQAAGSTSPSEAHEPSQSAPRRMSKHTLDATNPPKKGRSKACDECRKSKVCVTRSIQHISDMARGHSLTHELAPVCPRRKRPDRSTKDPSRAKAPRWHYIEAAAFLGRRKRCQEWPSQGGDKTRWKSADGDTA